MGSCSYAFPAMVGDGVSDAWIWRITGNARDVLPSLVSYPTLEVFESKGKPTRSTLPAWTPVPTPEPTTLAPTAPTPPPTLAQAGTAAPTPRPENPLTAGVLRPCGIGLAMWVALAAAHLEK